MLPITNMHDVLNSNAADLARLLLSLPKNSVALVYGKVLFNYLNGRLDELQSLKSQKLLGLSSEDSQLIETIIDLRMNIRQKLATQNNLCKKLIESAGHQHLYWQSEIYFVCALAAEESGREDEAKKHYEIATHLFYQAKIPVKAVKSLHNSIACESRINPERRLLVEYNDLYQQALTACEFGTAGAALNNISREYQLMGSLRIALQKSNDAVKLLREKAFGTYEFYLALCHRIHLYLESGWSDLALIDYEEARASNLIEVKEALAVLRSIFPQELIEFRKNSEPPPSPKTFTWNERLLLSRSCNRREKFTDKESSLLNFIATKPSSISEIGESLYPDSNNFEGIENRVKQLIFRVRKKSTSIIGHHEGKYFIIDSSNKFAESAKMKSKSPTRN